MRIRPLFYNPLLIFAALVLSAVAYDWRSPFFVAYRMEVHLAFVVISALVIFSGIAIWRSSGFAKTRPHYAYAAGLAAIVAFVALLAVGIMEARFQWMRHWVLTSDQARLTTFGRHFIVGYWDVSFAEELASRGAVGGFFVTHHNVVGKDIASIRKEVDKLKALVPENETRHLWLASDQEGGGVTRLSPPLPPQQSLSNIVAFHENSGERIEAIRAYAIAQGNGLASLGINLNLSPVVDLKTQTVGPNDRYTRIFERAIHSDPFLVAATGSTYCSALATTGVQCTLKHFPGIGRVINDTHVESASLDAPAELLTQSDWVPFRVIMDEKQPPFVMLSHVRLMELDKQYPVSCSHRVVSGLLRGEWGFNGVLITDDFSMRAIQNSSEGIGGATIEALNAGVDLILISYDSDQYFRAMYAVLRADMKGELNRSVLDKSKTRLDFAGKVGFGITGGSQPKPVKVSSQGY
ncbi:MAG: glycoside hydrolase family 3 N-terminal domain-containing protein [Pseudomonadota bacterium]